MRSNSKLNDGQKSVLKDLRNWQKKTGFAQVDGVSVVVQRTGANSGRFSVSVASLDEKKIRPKVGEFCARNRLYDGEAQPCRLAAKSDLIYGVKESEYLQNVAYEIAEKLTELD